MKSEIIFRDGRRVNLAFGVTPGLYAELEATHSPRLDPALSCGSCGTGIYIQHGRLDRNQLYGYHHAADGCATTFDIAGPRISDEHKRQAEYHVRAAERVGLNADTEVTTTGHTRVDVVIDGRIGIEVQRSDLKKAAAVDRTARSVAAGLEAVAWFTDREGRPQWTGFVPGYRTTVRGWKELPPERTAGAAGIQSVECARRPVLTAGRYRTKDVPQLVQVPMLIDDVVPAMVTGQVRAVRLGEYVRLLTADGIALYEELTGIKLTYDPGKPRQKPLPPSVEERCQRQPPALHEQEAVDFHARTQAILRAADAVILSWGDRKHYGCHAGRCVSCGKGAFLVNDDGHPQHKVCAEREFMEARNGAP